MQKKYIVRLSEEERCELQEVIKKLKGSSQKVRPAKILLKADIEGANWTNERIAEAFDCRTKTVENIRRRLVEKGFCEKIVLVCDQLNTHTKGAFYEVFEPQKARQLVQRIEFCYTPKHGSWREHC